MSTMVEKIVQEVRSLSPKEKEELWVCLANDSITEMDEWDRQMEKDFSPGGRGTKLIERARADIAAGRTKPLDEIINNS